VNSLTASTLLAAIATAALAACASDAPAPSVTPSTATASRTIEGSDRVERMNAIQVTAIVKQIDHATRRVTLQLPEGRDVELVVGESAKNLSQVSVGDQVRATYYESLVFQVRKPGEAQPGTTGGSGLTTAEPGSMPGGLALSTRTVTTTVKAIDREKQTITLVFPDGSVQRLPVQNPANLDKVKVGELLEITYSEALAIEVEKP
jgi:Cu/Ag efflux protein CusF